MGTQKQTSDGTIFFHSEDFSDMVIIVVPTSEILVDRESSTVKVRVPFEALKELVADYVRVEWVKMIVDADPDELLLETKLG